MESWSGPQKNAWRITTTGSMSCYFIVVQLPLLSSTHACKLYTRLTDSL